MSLTTQVLTPSNVLDSTKAAELRNQVNDAIAAGTDIILIDLKDTSFIDSSGLGALVVALKSARTAGKQLYLCSLNEQAQMLLNLTSMNQVFPIYADQIEFKREVLGEA